MSARLTKIFLLCILGYCQIINAQKLPLKVLSLKDSLAIEKVNVFVDDKFIGETNAHGELTVKISFNKIRLTHVSYELLEVDSLALRMKSLVYLRPSQYELNEVVIGKERDKNYSSVNFGWNDKAATFIPFEDKGIIKKIKFRVRDYSGVKGLKYLPFKANIYTVGDDGRPAAPLIENDLLVENKEGKNWAGADVTNYNIKVPEEGLFLVFIIPEREFYDIDFIQAKVGVISAVPLLSRASRTDDRFSYRLEYASGCECYMWFFEKYHYFKMDVEYVK